MQDIYIESTNIRNKVGNEQMTLSLDWTGKENFVSKSLRDWKIDGQAVGVTRNYGPLTFATIAGAGHMVSHRPFRIQHPVNSLG